MEISQLSEEEIIDRIQDLIHTCDIGIEKHGEYDDLFALDKEALQSLLDLYKQEKEKNEELDEERKKYPIAMTDEQYKKVIGLAQKDIKEELERQINTRIINEEFIEKNFISKDKIKAKIEEYAGLKEIDKTAYEEQIKPLVELLEE